MWDIRNIALLCWLGAWTGPLLAYLLSADAGYVDWCIPHLQGCDSISASGRHGWGFFVFKATMLPVAGCTIVYWLLCRQWLLTQGTPPAACTTTTVVGLIGSIALILYVTFLGADGPGDAGDVYRSLRRYGTAVYFGFTYLAHLLLIKNVVYAPPSRLFTLLKLNAVFILVTGLTFGGMANLFADKAQLQNISEWNCATALTAFPLLVWLAWRKSNFHPA